MSRPSSGMGVSSDEAILAAIMRKILANAGFSVVYSDGEFEIDARVYLSEYEIMVVNKYV